AWGGGARRVPGSSPRASRSAARSSPRERPRGRDAASLLRRRWTPRAPGPWPSFRPRRGVVRLELPLPRLLPYFDEAVLRTRHRALDQQQVPLRIDALHHETNLCRPLAAEPSGQACAFEYAPRPPRGADRTG